MQDEELFLSKNQPAPHSGVLITSEEYNELRKVEHDWHSARRAVKEYLDSTRKKRGSE